MSTALAGTIGRRGRKDADFRIICTCQKESGLFARLRHHARAIGIGLPIALGLIAVPVRAISTAAEARSLERAEQALRSMPLYRGARIEMPTPIHSRPRRDIRATARLVDDLALEAARRDVFFREIPYGSIIYREAKRHGFAPELIAAVVEVESDFRPTLVSPKNAQGLMQIVPLTGVFMEASDLMDPADNIAAGVRYLRYLSRRYGDLTLVLAAYNAGEGNVARFGGIPPFGETHDYLKRVARSRFHYQQRIARRIAHFEGKALVTRAIADAASPPLRTARKDG